MISFASPPNYARSDSAVPPSPGQPLPVTDATADSQPVRAGPQPATDLEPVARPRRSVQVESRHAPLWRMGTWAMVIGVVGAVAQGPLWEQAPVLAGTNLLVAVAFGLAAALVADEPGQWHTAVALAAGAVLWPLAWVNEWHAGPCPLLAVLDGPAPGLIVVWGVLRYPRRWDRRRDEWGALALLASVQLWVVPIVVTSRAGWNDMPAGAWWPGFWPNHTAFSVAQATYAIYTPVAAVGLGTLLYLRISRLTGPDRRYTRPLAWAVLAAGLAFAATDAVWLVAADERTRYAASEFEGLVLLGVPGAFGVVAVRRRLAGEHLTRFAAGGPATSLAVEAALRETLADPTARVYYWAPAERSWVDGTGEPVSRTEVARGHFVREIVAADGGALALLTCDLNIDRHRAIIESAARVFALTLANERLQAAIRAEIHRETLLSDRVEGVIEAEQRRVSREISDGPRRHLDSLEARLEKILAGGPGSQVAATLTPALEQLRTSQHELERLVRGQTPLELESGGLSAAARHLAREMHTGMSVATSVIPDRFHPAVERTGYFVVAEAMTNAAKHARATRIDVLITVEADPSGSGTTLLIEVRDDGVGGADPAGHGLAGLAGRLAARGGTLAVHSPTGGGTLVTARVPLSDAPLP
jgi:signal transduction histidine kinase